MVCHVLDFHEIDQTQVAAAGGKGANLGELSRIDGVGVPAGFCVTTDAYRLMLANAPVIEKQLARLTRLEAGDRDTIRVLSAEIRATLEAVPMPEAVASAIADALERLGASHGCAVRSSATAEDSPTASFAGQLDTYLNVVGASAILAHVSRCWASLFTERAVTYRLRNGIDHRGVAMAVVVQRMIPADASGILFTADPLTGNRKVTSVEATFGLGEALVAGAVSPDVYTVRDGQLLTKTIGTKHLAIQATAGGGTREELLEPASRERSALSDAQVLKLVELGRRIEAHFGKPQDIEWCVADEDFHIVQSRPITTLFPIPAATDDANHVYLSVGHGQMMTDAMPPLGVSIRQLTAATEFHAAGGRVFVDVSRALASAEGRAGLMNMIGKGDPLIGDALRTLINRNFVPLAPQVSSAAPPRGAAPEPIPNDPRIVAELRTRSEESLAVLEREIQAKSGVELMDFIRQDFQELKRLLTSPLSHQAIMAGMEATWWLNDHLYEWLGEKNAADTLTQSLPDNITSEMGLELMNVADVIRPYPSVVAFLERVNDENFLNELPEVDGGRQARDAIAAWLDKHGMRGVGEIDITRPRWSERPSMLLPIILGNVKNFEPGAAKRRFDEGLRAASNKEAEVLARLRALDDADAKTEETKRMIDRVRTFSGYREYPKYAMVARLFVYKQALVAEAERLVHAGVLREKEDMFYLTFDELADAVRTRRADAELIERRKAEFAIDRTLTPPRVITSEGEVVAGSYRREDLPAGALVGLAVSAGTVEGRARVVLDVARADLDPGDILVTPYTDPSWTPLFVAIKGLVTEVGGLMTHGAVIAREYGLPAVVGVENATRLIRDGQRIRVHGTDGYVEILSELTRS